MKMKTKRIAGLALSAALALTVGAGVYGVVNAYEEPTVTASAAAITKDLSGSIYNVNEHYNGDWGTNGDFKEAGLYRFWISTDKTLAWNEGGSSLNEAGRDHLLEFVKVNGKTVKQWRDEYANGTTNKITWEGMPGNMAGVIHPNIGADVEGNRAIYAPIMVNVSYHGANYGSAIDIYIPTSFISDVTSIEFLTGFEWTYGGETFGFSENVYFGKNSLIIPHKIVGERNFTVKETTVTGIDGTYSSTTDQFLSFFLGENDYGTDNTVDFADKNFMRTLNFFDYILIDGEKMGTLWGKENPSEQFFNVWNRTGSFSTRWPRTLSNAGKTNSVQEITILAGCQFPSRTEANTIYQTTEDITFVRQESGAFADPSSLIGADDIAVNWATKADGVFKVDIICDAWTYNVGANGDIYDWNYFSNDRIAIRDNILINGKSLYEINTTEDDSAYEYAAFPFNASDLKQASYKDGQEYDVFMNPTLLEVKDGVISVLIYENYVNSLCKEFGDELVITVKKEICNSTVISGKVLTEDVSVVAYGIGYNLDLMDGDTKVDTMSILGGFALSGLPTLTADHKTFAGWVDADGNPAPSVMPNDNYTLYAKWNAVPYTLTINYLDDTSKTFTFGVIADAENGIELTVDDLAKVLEDNLPENTDEVGYAYVEKLPYAFEGQNYTFTVTTVQVMFTITFVGENGEDIGVAPITFTEKTIDSLVLPAVPEKAGYTGEWDKTLDRIKFEDTVLTAVYTEVKEEEPTPEIPDTPDNSTEETDSTDSTTTEQPGGVADLLAGCSGVVGGIASGMVALGVAVVALLKKKED